MQMPSRIARIAALGSLVLTTLVTPPARAYTPHELRWATNQDISSLNMWIATSLNVVPLSELTEAQFTRFDANGKPIPELITEIPSKANHGISADGKTITWHLRHNVKWSDGAPFSADDVVYTYHVAMDSANNIYIREPWERLKSVDKIDPYTVAFHFKEPYAIFIQDYFSTQGNSQILPKHILGPGTKINDAPYNSLPVGIGPFRYTAYHRGDSVEMEANPYYWRGKPKLTHVTYKIVTDENTLLTELQTGELDLWDTINGPLAQRVKSIPGRSWHGRSSNYVEEVFLEVEHAATRDPMVRRALELATNRPLILAKAALGNGILVDSPIPTVTEAYAALPRIPYDPAQAQKLLDAAGWKRGADGFRSKNGVPLAVDLALGSGQPTRDTEVNLLHDSWQSIGVRTTIHTWAAPQYFAIYAAGGTLQTSKFDAALLAQSLGPVYSNINGVFDCMSFPPRGANISRYCNKKLDAANDAYVHEFDATKRKQLGRTIQEELVRDTVVIPLYERVQVSAYDQRLTGYHPSAFSYWGDPLDLDI
jgi:peptide/nickel transport system substrate-binding protein